MYIYWKMSYGLISAAAQVERESKSKEDEILLQYYYYHCTRVVGYRKQSVNSLNYAMH